MSLEDVPITLNWVVPARRAVVTAECSYYDILAQWVHRLREHRDTLREWYGIGENDYDFRGVMWVVQWAYAMDTAISREERSISPATRNTFGRTRPWFVRIWFGPWRVLHADDWDTICNERGEVRDPMARFRPGDLIEFPFHLFLHACQLDGFESIHFNGQGSPFLGNSVLKDGSPPSGGFALHDNMLAMRFQLLLNLAIGAFFSNQQVHGAQREPLFENNENHVYARGMIYGGSFAKRIMDAAAVGVDRHWGIWTNNWCRAGVATSSTIPTPRGRAAMVSGAGHLNSLRLTPAWACSPCTLMLTFYMLNGDQGGADNVSRTWGYTGVRDNGTPPVCATRITNDMLSEAVGGFANPSEIKTLQVLPGPGGESVDHQIANFPGAVNVISRAAHEEGFVKLLGPQCLADREVSGDETPHVGFLCAYNPFTGSDYCPAELAETGQLYQFEASDSLGRWRAFNAPEGGRHVYGPSLFKWSRYENNQLRMRRSGLMTFHPTRQRMPRTVRMFCIQLEENNHPDSYGHGQVYRPIVFRHPGNRDQPMDSDEAVNTRYARRAIPFMTMDEFQALGLYDTMQEVDQKIQSVITEFSNHVRTRLVTEVPPAPAEGAVESDAAQRRRRLILARRLLQSDYQQVAAAHGEGGNHVTFFQQLGFSLDSP